MPKDLKEAEDLAQRLDMQSVLCGPEPSHRGGGKVNAIGSNDELIQKLAKGVELLAANQKEMMRTFNQNKF